VLHSTGNQDLCYYNYLCSHPLWLLSDFNHVYSNIGYIMLGILFLILVFRKDRMHMKLLCQCPGLDAVSCQLLMRKIINTAIKPNYLFHVCSGFKEMRNTSSFWLVLRYGSCIDNGRSTKCLLSRLSKSLEFSV